MYVQTYNILKECFKTPLHIIIILHKDGAVKCTKNITASLTLKIHLVPPPHLSALLD